jgi:HNH endonuclease
VSACIPSVNKPNLTHGYARRVIDGRTQYEHVAAWEAVNGPVPPGMVLDHTCHDPNVCHLGNRCPHRSCRNPDHLTPVTRGENVSRAWNPNRDKTHCKDGHEFTPDNTYVTATGSRRCRTCYRIYLRHWKRERLSRLPSR